MDQHTDGTHDGNLDPDFDETSQGGEQKDTSHRVEKYFDDGSHTHNDLDHSDTAREQEKPKDPYGAYATTEEISAKRSMAIKRTFAFASIVGLSLVLAQYFFRAKSEVAQDELRRTAVQQSLPPDLNLTSESIMWQRTKDVEFAQMQDEMNRLHTLTTMDKNISHDKSPDGKQLSKDEVAAMVQAQVQAILKNSNSKVSQSPYPEVPQKQLKVKLPPNANPTLKKIAQNSGNPNELSTDDFLSKPLGSPPPPTVQQIQQKTEQIPFGQTTVQTLPLSPQSNSASSNNGQRVTITEARDLKTAYSISQDDPNSDTNKGYFILTGLAKASLYTGFRAATLSIGEQQTQPVFMSLDSNIIGANNSSFDVKDCTVSGTSRGNLNSGRAEIRLDELNCGVRYKNGKNAHITKKINGWVYGEDGIFGLKGRIVSSEGKIFESAIPIALIQALVGGLSQANGLTQTLVPGIGITTGTAIATTSGTVSAPTGMDLVEKGAITGMGRGANQALSQAVSYYMNILKELNPAVEILGGRTGLTVYITNVDKVKKEETKFFNLEEIKKERK